MKREPSASRECEDCEEAIPDENRRKRCKHCGLLICPWCAHHVHNGLYTATTPDGGDAKEK